jgi:type VI secretion system protein ImpG
MGAEFSREYPKIAARLGLEAFECADPYVERLLEGFSFLAARVQLRIESEFPRFTQHLLEMVYPHYLSPTPSMAVVRFNAQRDEGALAGGFPIPRGTVLRSILGKGDQTPCEYRTAHDLTLWPVEVAEAAYFTSLRDVGLVDAPLPAGVKSGVRIKLRTLSGMPFGRTSLERLVFYLRGGGGMPLHLYEQLLGNTKAVVVRPPGHPPVFQEILSPGEIHRVGYSDEEALLPYGLRSFSGYRLLHEYFAFPERFLFVEFGGLGSAVERTEGNELEIIALFDRSDPVLEGTVDATQFELYCVPAVNLFPKRADRIHLNEKDHEYHVVADRTRPMDFEVYTVREVVGHGSSAEDEQTFLPFYAFNDLTRHQDQRTYFSLRRLPRVLSANQRRYGPRSSYVGSETWVALVDAEEAPYLSSLKQLSVDTLCTNRDLPLMISIGQGSTDFTLQAAAPVESVRILTGPTRPRPSAAEGDTAWRVVSHLALNYLSLADRSVEEGASALRELLLLYGADAEQSLGRQIDGVRSIRSRPVIRRIDSPGPLAFGRGQEVEITFDESAFGGSGVFLLGSVLEQFFARYVSINSFTETVVRSMERGEVMRWPARPGRRHTM